MIWGCFRYHGIGELKYIDVKMDAGYNCNKRDCLCGCMRYIIQIPIYKVVDVHTKHFFADAGLTLFSSTFSELLTPQRPGFKSPPKLTIYNSKTT